MLFVAIGMQSAKENPTLLKLKINFNIYLWFTCVEDDNTFKVVVHMCYKFDEGSTKYNKTTPQRVN